MNLRKVIAMLTAMVMLFGCGVFAAEEEESTAAITEFSDVPSDAPFYQGIMTLAKLGVINGYPDGTFQMNNNVTRAEFTAMLMRVLGLGGISAQTNAALPFSDISDSSSSWAIGNIVTAHDMGIINGMGDGTFKPNDNVTFEQAVKMVVCALGYESASQGLQPADGEWYSGYMAVANNLGITKRAGGQVGVAATRGTIAQLIFDSLEVDIMTSTSADTWTVQTGKNILSEHLKLIKATGKISSNRFTSLTSPNLNLRADELQITDEETNISAIYRTTDPALRDMIGTQVTYYYSQVSGTDTRELILANPIRTEILEINADQIEHGQSNASTIRYYRNRNSDSNTASASIPANSVVILNGQLYGPNAAQSSFSTYYAQRGLPRMGKVRLIDGGGGYNTVIIDSYNPYVVRTVVASTKQITDDYIPWTDNSGSLTSARRSLELDEDLGNVNVEIVDKNGDALAFNNIKSWDVICVKESNADNGAVQIRTAVVLNSAENRVSGDVVEAGSDYVRIGSTSYEYSLYAPWVIDPNATVTTHRAPKLGDRGTFYLDIEGKIIAFDRSSESTSKTYYAYLQGLSLQNTLDDETIKLRLLSEGSTKSLDITLAKTVEIDGKSFNTTIAAGRESVLSALEKAAKTQNNDGGTNASYTQVIKYTTSTISGENVISNIITADSGIGSTSTNDPLEIRQQSNIAGIKFRYDRSGSTLIPESSSASSIRVNSSTLVFIVPPDRQSYTRYRKSAATSEFEETVAPKYMIEAYDVSNIGVAKIVVLYADSAYKEITADTGILLITDITQSLNPTTEASATRIKGLLYDASSSGSAKEYWVAPDVKTNVDILKRGDIIRCELNSEDEISDYTLTLNRSSSGTVTTPDRRLFSPTSSEGFYNFDTATGKSETEAEFRVINGSILQREDDSSGTMIGMSIVPNILESGNATAGSPMMYIEEKSKLSSAVYMKFDSTQSGNSQLSAAKFEDLNSSSSYGDVTGLDTKPQQVFIYETGGKIKLIYLIK